MPLLTELMDIWTINVNSVASMLDTVGHTCFPEFLYLGLDELSVYFDVFLLLGWGLAVCRAIINLEIEPDVVVHVFDFWFTNVVKQAQLQQITCCHPFFRTELQQLLHQIHHRLTNKVKSVSEWLLLRLEVCSQLVDIWLGVLVIC